MTRDRPLTSVVIWCDTAVGRSTERGSRDRQRAGHEAGDPRRRQALPARRGLRGDVDAQGRHRSRRSAVAGPLPLRVQGRTRRRPARTGGPSTPRSAGGDVLGGSAAVEAVRAGVRLPRGRPRVGLRARAAGDDRRRMVEPRAGREGPGDAAGLARPADRCGDRSTTIASVASGRSRPRRSPR